MKFNAKKVLVAGGTGFLGYHSVLLFNKMGIKTGVATLKQEQEIAKFLPKDTEMIYADLFKSTQSEIFNLFKNKGYDSFVYALGPDDRITPPAPAFDFFKTHLVDHCKKICLAAKQAGMKRCVVLNSYFAYFNRLKNGKLAKNHPYIKARVMQAEEIAAIGKEGEFDVMVLELPYIFGTMPLREPLWKKVFLDRFENFSKIYFPNGGTNAVAVEGVAQGVVAAVLNGVHNGRYQIGDENITYKTMLNTMMQGLGSKKRFFPVPAFLCAAFAGKLMKEDREKGLESGLNYKKLMTQIQSKKFYFNPETAKKALNYEELGFKKEKTVHQSILETMKKILETNF